MGYLLPPVSLGLIVVLLAVVLTRLYQYVTRHYNFWLLQGVPHQKPQFPYGSVKDLTLGRVRIGEAYDRLYHDFQGERYFGVIELNYPVLIIRDPDLIRRVLIKDFNYFVDRDAFQYNPREFINNHLSSMRGDAWKGMRQRLAPAFSTKKIRSMYHLMTSASDELLIRLSHIAAEKQSINVKELFARFSMDIIASCAFGVEINSLSDENNKFYRNCKSLFKGSFKKAVIKKLLALFPSVSSALNLQRVPIETQRMMLSIISRTVRYREEHGVDRGDFLDILIRLKHNKTIQDDSDEENDQEENSPSDLSPTTTKGLTLKEMTAQAFIFFAAGYETSSSAMSCVLYELARHLEVQKRLCQEVDDALKLNGGHLCCQAILNMEYMDQVINETLRLYPTAGVLHRRCTKDYAIPDSPLVLMRGQKLCIPVNAIHHDPTYFPNPYLFDPERFSSENMRSRPPCVFLPFGDGPRSCIGVRFGLMQIKTGLATFMSKFQVDVAPETPKSLEFETSSIISVPKHIYLKISERNKFPF